MSRFFYNGAKVYHRLDDAIRVPAVTEEPRVMTRHGRCFAPSNVLVFSVDNGKNRYFLRFETFDDFEPWYLGLEPHKRTLSEVITSDMRKLVLDIDNPDAAMADKLLMYDFKRHVTSRISQVFSELDIGRPDVIFYTMCSDDKISYHVVVSNFVFSAQTCAGLCMIISSKQAWDCCVDMSVYKRVQFMRLESSTKFGENRWKNRLTAPGSLRHGILSDFEETSVSNFTAAVYYGSNISDNYMFIPSERGLPYGRQRPTCSPERQEHHDFRAFINDQFRRGIPNGNNSIPLYRIKPGFCIQCKRGHDRENAFMRYVKGRPVFMCWRYYYTCRS